MTESKIALKRIAVMTDGRPGNENQALGLAEAVARRLEALGAEAARPRIDIHRLRLKAWADPAPPFALDAAFRIFGDRACRSSLRDAHEVTADLVIGAGRRSAAFVAASRRRGARAVQLLNPQMRFDAFDLIAAPAHDQLTGANVSPTVGSMHRVFAEDLANLALDPRLKGLGRSSVAVLVGGVSRSATLEPAERDAFLARLEALATSGVSLLITASRRTPAPLADALSTLARGGKHFFWDQGGDNPYFSMLSKADAVIVTADSVNMASEAAALGKPLYVARLGRLAPKLERFHEALAARGCVKPVSEVEGFLDWAPEAFDDRAAVVERVVRLF